MSESGQHEEPTIEGLRGEVEALRASTVAELKAVEGERDVHAARVTELEAAQAVTQGELESARGELQALKDAAARVPGGGGERQAPDLSGLSPREKITLGLSQRG